MRHRAALAISVALIICLFLDNVIFSRYNIVDIRPDMLIALAVCLGLNIGSIRALCICGGAGLVNDIMFSVTFGANALVYLIGGAVSGLLFRKFYADNVVVPAITAAALTFVKNVIFGLYSAIGGANGSVLLMLATYALPCAVITGGVCIPMYLILKPFLAQYSRFVAEKNGLLY